MPKKARAATRREGVNIGDTLWCMIDSDDENCLYTVDNIIEDEDECYLWVRALGRTHRARTSRLPPGPAWVSPSQHAACPLLAEIWRRARQPDDPRGCRGHVA